MEQIIPTVGILRVGIDQIGLMLRVYLLFIVDSRNILLQLFLRIAIASVVFCYPEMFDIRNLITLFYTKIRRIGFVRIKNRILIYRFIFVFYLIHIQKIGNPHLFHRPQNFIVQCLRFQGFAIDDSLNVFVQITF